MSVFEKYVPAATAFLASGYNPDMEPAILKRCLYILLELSEAGQDLEIENRALREDVECLKQSLEWRDGVIADLRRKLEQAAKEAGE
ncbi:MAG: hypothetical protein IKY97_07780 [Mailhella sp.]|nr:hypothetical protein [Mailhella sp.]